MYSHSLIVNNTELPRVSDFEDVKKYENVLLQLFVASSNIENVQCILNKIHELVPGACIVGTSTDEAINSSEIIDNDSVVISMLGSNETRFSSHKVTFPKCPEEAGRQLAECAISSDTKLLLSFCDAQVNGELLLNGISKINENVIVSGGVASTPTFENTFVIYGNEIIFHGAVVVAFNSRVLSVYRDKAFGWECIGKKHVITKATGNRVEGISNQSPKSLFKHYLGENVVKNLPGLGSAFPLMVQRDGFTFARGIIGVDGEAFLVSGNVNQGDTVFIGYGNLASILEQNTLANQLDENVGIADVIFSYYCEGRKLFLPRELAEYEINTISNNAPHVGCFMLGEFYSANNNHQLLNFSSTCIALKEDILDGEGSVQTQMAKPELQYLDFIAEGLFKFINVRTNELADMAYHDELTGLPNANYLKDNLAQFIEGASTQEEGFSLIYMHVQGFDKIYNILGNKNGVDVLRLLISRLLNVVGNTHALTQYGDETFIIIYRNDFENYKIQTFLQSLLDLFSEPLIHREREFYVSVSIGISQYPLDGRSEEELIDAASNAMYFSKKESDSSFAFYDRKIKEEIYQQQELELELRKAITNNEFTVYYQPKVDIKSEKIVGAEALIRWIHPEKGFISPVNFIPIAENSGLILQIGKWILKEACIQAKQWVDEYQLEFRMAVNISARQLEQDLFTNEVMNVLSLSGLPPKMLELEITESMVMEELERCLLYFRVLKESGVTLALDDFGTGYSSLAYLEQLPVEHLKIDKSFIDDVCNHESKESIASAIISMGHSLGLTVIAEGVETKEQLDKLKQLNCDEIQGYYYSKPLPAIEFQELLKNNLSKG